MLRVVFGHRAIDDLRIASSEFDHFLRELQDREFPGVADIHRADDLVLIHQANKAFNQVIDIAEGTGLLAFAIDGDVLSLQGLHDEVGNHASIIRQHAWAVGVENTHDTNINLILTMVVEEQGLRAALAFVVARADTDGIDIAPIAFGLWMDIWVAIDLGGGGLKDSGIDALGQAEAINRAHDGGLGGLDWIVLVVHRRRGASEVVDLVDLQFERIDHIVAHQLEIRVVEQVRDIALTSSEEVVHTDHFVPFIEETFRKMGAEEASSAGD